jgi:predicted transcriptional regulator
MQMPRSVPISLRISEEKAREIEAFAKATDRSKSWLLEQALDTYLETQTWQVARIERGLAEIERGAGRPHEEVAEWLAGWGRDDEGKPPR